MNTGFFYAELGFEQLMDCAQVAISRPEYRELGKLGADKVYFSGDFPAILFKEVRLFDEKTLRNVAEIQRKIWNYRKVMFLYVLSDTEIRIYNCYEKPKYLAPDINVYEEMRLYEIFKTSKNNKADRATLIKLFSQAGVDCGLLWADSSEIQGKVNIQRRIDRYMTNSFVITAQTLYNEIKDEEIIHALMIRSMFILYLEDKGAAKEAWIYSRIKPDADTYFDILDDVDATYRLFDELSNSFDFNIFPVTERERQLVTEEHLQKIKNCFIDGETFANRQPHDKWRIFDFSLIQIEVLCEVYENFLGELKDKKDKGQFYTPSTLVELMLNDKLPFINETDYNVKTLDITCCSGIFLVESYKRLVRRWKNASPGKEISFDDLQNILVNNIFGIDIDPMAIKAAASFLYLTLIEHLEHKTLWIKKEYRLPPLINNPSAPTFNGDQGKNLWCGDAVGEIDAEKFAVKADLLTGNPPSGTDRISRTVKDYLDARKYAQEKALAFMDKATQFVNTKGVITLIFNAKILTNTNKNYRNFRKWLFNTTYVEKIYNLSVFRRIKKDFGGQLFFNPAAIPVCIVCYKKTLPYGVQNTVEYYAPQTYVQPNLADALVVDKADIKFLPRYECQKPDTKIWKIAMWGNIRDFHLLSRLNNKSDIYLKSYFKDDKWLHATGLNGDSKHKDFVPDSIIETKEINRYYTSVSVAVPNDKYYRKIDQRLFQPPFIVVKKGQKDNRQTAQVTASYIDHPAYFKSGVFIMNKNDALSLEMKKSLVAFFNSDLATYYLFLSTSSWGIERDQIMLNEYLELPAFFQNNSDLSVIAGLFDEMVNELKQETPCLDLVKQKETEINRTLENIIGLTDK
ncbi:MAG: N-6 DNA methylase, partial [Prevotellaceae bacterium]|nr:N-6 DNA methylase [Prevotellaceae bacterium]